jgi:hypothetical protein
MPTNRGVPPTSTIVRNLARKWSPSLCSGFGSKAMCGPYNPGLTNYHMADDAHFRDLITGKPLAYRAVGISATDPTIPV